MVSSWSARIHQSRVRGAPARPPSPLPDELNDRAQDVCEPRLVIADLAGASFVERIDKTEAARRGRQLARSIGIAPADAEGIELTVSLDDLLPLPRPAWAFISTGRVSARPSPRKPLIKRGMTATHTALKSESQGVSAHARRSERAYLRSITRTGWFGAASHHPSGVLAATERVVLRGTCDTPPEGQIRGSKVTDRKDRGRFSACPRELTRRQRAVLRRWPTGGPTMARRAGTKPQHGCTSSTDSSSTFLPGPRAS